jgi:formylmethanofuran dehydrogenase subunit A
MTALLKIAGGHVVDPANDIDGVHDLWIQDGRVVGAPADPSVVPDRTIDARGYVVMPGGVDMHSHIAGPKVSAARALRPDDKREAEPVRRTAFSRSGTLGSVPSTFATGYRYAGLGYTTAIDAAVPPLGARQAHHELRDTPVIDKALLVLMGNNHFVMDLVRAGDQERLRSYVAWLLGATRGYGVKVVDPGGVESWKQGQGGLTALDAQVPHFDVSPRQILEALAQTVDALGLPHPLHLHGLGLGMPGNAAITLETMKALEGHRAHFAHIQFHSYGGSALLPGSIHSEVVSLADHVNAHPNHSVDVGQALFGDTTTMTADGPVGHFLHTLTGRRWVSHDIEMETGCGVVPITYQEKNVVHALQWSIGLEWFLRVNDPWRVAMSTDHPNGGSFLAYPKIIALLMDRGLRADMLKRLPAGVRKRCALGELPREYSLREIAVITRAGPARLLGLPHKGHLGAGADADITIYSPSADRERMFSMPRYVLKAGTVVVDDGDIRQVPDGLTLHSAPEFDRAILPDVEAMFERFSSIEFANYPVRDEDLVVDPSESHLS